MQHLIKTLPSILRAGGNSREVLEAAAIAAWKHVAGEKLSSQAVATHLDDKTLVIAVSDIIWQKQLESMAAQLLFRLNSTLGQPIVGRLLFCIDPSLPARAFTPSPGAEVREVTKEEVSLELWSAASAIQDKRLRSIFLVAATKSIRRQNQED